MDSLLEANVGIATGAATLIFTSLVWYFFFAGVETPIQYEVDIPDIVKAGSLEDFELLLEPSINVKGSTVINCYCPANGRLLGRVNPVTTDGIDRAIAKAKEAQIAWSGTTFAQRRKVLVTLLNYVLTHQEAIAKAACLDSGKTRVDASFGEILVTCEKIRWTLAHGEAALRPSRRPTNLLMTYKVNDVLYEPLGVVAALVSWNYPFHNLLNPIISALFSGNAIIVKVSEQTVWSAQFYTSIVRGALTALGHSPQLVQCIACWPNVAPHLTSHPDISHITFIGSRPVALKVAASAATALIPVCAELGGKDPAIVLDDAPDLESTASVLMRGVFQSAGQNCIGIERVIATSKAYTRLVEMIFPRVKALRVGSAMDTEENVDMGACISDAGFSRLEQLIADAVSRGATLHCGGKRYKHPEFPEGHYFAPTFLSGVTTDMPIAQTELFAPIFVLMKANDVENAIDLANSTMYALGASVFGSNKSDLEKVVKRVKAGMVSVNDFATYYMCSMPFGGVKGSGYGRFGGEEGLRSLCNLKSVSRDWIPGVRTSIPPALDYPTAGMLGDAKKMQDKKAKAWSFVKGIVELGYGIDLRMKVGGLSKLIANG